MTDARVWVRPDRPQFVLRARPWTWRNPDTPDEQGIGIVISTSKIIQFLTADQAVQLSNQLIDSVDAITTEGNAS